MRNDVVIQIAIDSFHYKQLDLFDDQAISLEFRNNMLSSIDKITCSSSYTVKVPHTVNNDYLLKLAKVPSFVTTGLADPSMLYRKIGCRAIVNGLDMIGEAWCYIADCDEDTYSLVITFGLLQDLNTWLTEKPGLRDLNPNNTKIGDNRTTKEYIDWNANSGVTIWQNDYPSKYSSSLRSMYFGTYDCGVSNTQVCNIHPWVSLREIWERIMNENSISITVPGTVKTQMERIGLLLTSNNTKNYATGTTSVNLRIMQSIGWVTDQVQYLTMLGTEGDCYHNVVPRAMGIGISPTEYTTPAKWNEFGFLHKGEGSVTIHSGSYSKIYVGGLEDWEQGVPAYLYGTTTYRDYFASHAVSDMKMYYPLPSGQYQEVTAQRDSGMNCVYFNIPTITADGSRPIIGSLIFSFVCVVNGKQIQFNHAAILTSYSQSDAEGNASSSVPVAYDYQYNVAAYNASNGIFSLVENLPDISQIDFVKAVCNFFGLFITVSTKGLELVRFSKIADNIGICYDWSDMLVDTGRPSPQKIAFSINDYARRNAYGYKDDDKDISAHRSVDYLIVENDLLEKESTLVEFPWAASATSGFNAVPIIPQYYFNDNAELQFNALAYRLLQADGIPDNTEEQQQEEEQNERTPPSSITLSFPAWMEASALLVSNYTEYQDAIRKPKVITERIMLNEYELKNLDFTRPVYLKKYGHYFAIISARWSSNSKTSEVKLLLLN